MAKSLRSKRQRRMRAIKRVRYGEKELKRLLTILPTSEQKVDMSDICTVLKRGTLSQSQESSNEHVEKKETLNSNESQESVTKDSDTNENTGMEIDAPKRKYNRITMTDEHGHYPVWMSKRAIRKLKIKTGRIAKKVKKQKRRKA